MNSPTIENILKERGAWLKVTSGDRQQALSNAALSRTISSDYINFERVRDALFKSTDDYVHKHAPEGLPMDPAAEPLLAGFIKANMVSRSPTGHYFCETKGKRYLSGSWLEELAWLAVLEAGADEALFSQVIGWDFKGFTGENEIDVIARVGEHLTFISCKALRSELDMSDRKHRSRLMDAVHEADNLEDHFGMPGEKVAVLVTTDLFDEMKGTARYNALMGKAAVLDVSIIPLEDLEWTKLVQALKLILAEGSSS